MLRPASVAYDDIVSFLEQGGGGQVAYVALADRVEQDLGLSTADVDANHLGATDTFRFEEHRLLIRSAVLVANKQFETALDLIAGRSHSFWVDRRRSTSSGRWMATCSRGR